MINEFKNKRILVTGGTGSIGSVIVRELLKYKPKQIRVYSRDESKQFELMHKIPTNAPVNFLIGDVRDKERLNLAMENIDIVFHAAALKHVSSCEKNPFEAVKTNVRGTQNIIDCAFANNVDKVVGISTDKATDPSNVMGCTKMLAEKIMLASYFYKGNKKTKFSMVRFGNVLGSRGSVVPLFINQIKNGNPVTVTNSQMTRFFMSIPQAVDLVFKATALMKDREIFVLKMPVLNIKDLVKAVLEVMQEKDPNLGKVPVKIIGKKNGERMHEKLLTIEESHQALENKEMFIILPNYDVEDYDLPNYIYPNTKKARKSEYNSNKQRKMTIKQIKEMLMNNEDINFK